MADVPHNPAGGSGPEWPESGWTAGSQHLDPDDPLLLERLGLHVPDDASALERDRRALLSERRRRKLSEPHPQLTALAVTFALLGATVALTGWLIGVLTPTAETRAPSAYALAAHPLTTPGAVGGLLPDVGVTLDGTVGMSAQDLRPAVLLVPPASADGACPTCDTAIDTLRAQAGEYDIDVHLVASPERAEEARAVLARAGTGAAHLLLDPSGSLTAAFAGSSARAVLVHADGIVGGVRTNLGPTARLEQFLSPLRLPGAPPSLQPATTSH